MFNSNLLHLLHLCDPSLPVGGFSHSAGLETYVQAGGVCNKQTTLAFIRQQLTYNIANTDAAFMSLAYDAATAGNMQKIIQLDEECSAFKMPKEMRLASNKLGIRLLKIFKSNTSLITAKSYWENIQKQKASGHYCIAFGITACELQIPKAAALTGFFYNAATGFVTNSVKLIPLGQQDGQDMLMDLFPLMETLAKDALVPNMQLLGYCCPAFDIRSMQHEQLYSRLYMS